MQSHDLYEELSAFDPRWQVHYDTLAAAAKAAGCSHLLPKQRRSVDGIPDYHGQQRAAQRALEAAIRRYGVEYTDDEAYDD
jgi:hypothetical protein